MSIAFDNRLVVVTGGTGALGAAVTGRLLAAGARVRIPVFNETELERFAFRDDERVGFETGVDLSDPAQVDAFYVGSGDLWASVHIAGGFGMGPITDEGQPALYDKMMAMNARTCFLCCRRAAVILAGRGGGRIVNVSAQVGVAPSGGSNLTAYAMSKAAVAALTQALASELKPAGVWVNAIAPTIIDTPANRAAMPSADHASWPKVEELAETIGFLASPQNMITTGGLVPVCGKS